MQFNHPNLLLSKGDEKLFHVPNVLYDNRYCKQDDFNILICGANTVNSGYKKALNDVYKLNVRTFECSKYPSMIDGRSYCQTAVVNSDILVVGGHKFRNSSTEYLYSVEVFENYNKAWSYKSELPEDRIDFCICTFKQTCLL